MVGLTQCIVNMNHQPPLDQRIVDDYFQLISHKKTEDAAWLFGMVATYGQKPEELINFSWNNDGSICLKNKKRSVKPLHPQWVILFNLQKKRPYIEQGRLESISSHLYRLMAYQSVSLNITDLLLAHSLRKKHYKRTKQLSPAGLVFAGAS